MKIRAFLAALCFVATSAFAQVEFKQGRVWIEGERQDETVWIRSCFKHPAYLSYHFTGQGGGPFYNLGTARAFVDHQQSLGFQGCRVLMEMKGWRDCENGQTDDGKPACMFGGEPRDQGMWNVEQLRNGGRPTEMHGVARNALEWYFQTSEETGFIFEVVIIATLKHNDVDVGQQTHVVRQTLAEGYRLQKKYPRARIVMNAINEWNAHSRWTLAEVNMLAVRADRWKHPNGQTAVGCSAPPPYEAEQWPCGPLIVDGGGGNTFEFDVGPEAGKFDLGAVHPDRGEGWERFPTQAQQQRLVIDSRGQPWGITEFMYLCEPGEEARRARGNQNCGNWYGIGGWTVDTEKYAANLAHLKAIKAPYVVVHDECGVGSILGWPVADCWVDRWARANLPNAGPPPEPPEPTPTAVYYDRLIEFGYMTVLGRSTANDPAALETYNPWFRDCIADPARSCVTPFLDVLARSQEFQEKNTR